ncbi:MAG: PHD finger domain-containing protein [Sedimenticola sp.]
MAEQPGPASSRTDRAYVLANTANEHMTYSMKKGMNLVITLSSAAFRLFELETNRKFSDPSFASLFNIETAQNVQQSGRTIDTVHKVSNKKKDGSEGQLQKFTMNLYNTQCSILVNGFKKTEVFIDNFLYPIERIIKDEFSSLTDTNRLNHSAMVSIPSLPPKPVNLTSLHIDTDECSIQNIPSDECPHCESTVERGIQCSNCIQWYHYTCEEIPTSLLDIYEEEDCEYLCLSCRYLEEGTSDLNQSILSACGRRQDDCPIVNSSATTTHETAAKQIQPSAERQNSVKRPTPVRKKNSNSMNGQEMETNLKQPYATVTTTRADSEQTFQKLAYPHADRAEDHKATPTIVRPTDRDMSQHAALVKGSYPPHIVCNDVSEGTTQLASSRIGTALLQISRNDPDPLPTSIGKGPKRNSSNTAPQTTIAAGSPGPPHPPTESFGPVQQPTAYSGKRKANIAKKSDSNDQLQHAQSYIHKIEKKLEDSEISNRLLKRELDLSRSSVGEGTYSKNTSPPQKEQQQQQIHQHLQSANHATTDFQAIRERLASLELQQLQQRITQMENNFQIQQHHQMNQRITLLEGNIHNQSCHSTVHQQYFLQQQQMQQQQQQMQQQEIQQQQQYRVFQQSYGGLTADGVINPYTYGANLRAQPGLISHSVPFNYQPTQPYARQAMGYYIPAQPTTGLSYPATYQVPQRRPHAPVSSTTTRPDRAHRHFRIPTRGPECTSQPREVITQQNARNANDSISPQTHQGVTSTVSETVRERPNVEQTTGTEGSVLNECAEVSLQSTEECVSPPYMETHMDKHNQIIVIDASVPTGSDQQTHMVEKTSMSSPIDDPIGPLTSPIVSAPAAENRTPETPTDKHNQIIVIDASVPSCSDQRAHMMEDISTRRSIHDPTGPPTSPIAVPAPAADSRTQSFLAVGRASQLTWQRQSL